MTVLKQSQFKKNISETVCEAGACRKGSILDFKAVK